MFCLFNEEIVHANLKSDLKDRIRCFQYAESLFGFPLISACTADLFVFNKNFL